MLISDICHGSQVRTPFEFALLAQTYALAIIGLGNVNPALWITRQQFADYLANRVRARFMQPDLHIDVVAHSLSIPRFDKSPD